MKQLTENSAALTQERSHDTESMSLELNKVGVHVVTITSAFIGCWAVVVLYPRQFAVAAPLVLFQILSLHLRGKQQLIIKDNSAPGVYNGN